MESLTFYSRNILLVFCNQRSVLRRHRHSPPAAIAPGRTLITAGMADMNDRNAAGILTKQGRPMTAIAHGGYGQQEGRTSPGAAPSGVRAEAITDAPALDGPICPSKLPTERCSGSLVPMVRARPPRCALSAH
jgi:hypothetical protein